MVQERGVSVNWGDTKGRGITAVHTNECGSLAAASARRSVVFLLAGKGT